MNKKNVLRALFAHTIVLLFISFTGKAQDKNNNTDKDKPQIINNDAGKTTNTYMVVYNFSTKVYDTNFVRPRINHPVVFKITNINRFAYDVTITSKDSTLVLSDISEEAAIVKVPTETTTPEKREASPTLAKPVTDDLNKGLTKDSANKHFDDLNSMVRQLQLEAQFTDLQKKLNSNYEASDKLSVDSVNYKRFTKEANDSIGIVHGADSIAQLNERIANLKKAQTKTDNALSQLRLEQGKINDAIKTIDTDLKAISIKNAAIREYANKLSSLQKNYADVIQEYRKVWELFRKNNQLLSISTQPLLSPQEFKKACKDSSLMLNDNLIFEYRNSISNFYYKISDFFDNYNLVINDYEIVRLLSNEGVVRMQASARALKTSVENMKEIVRERKPNEILDKMVHAFKTMTKENAYEIVSASIQPSQDLVVFNIQITHKSTKEYKDDRTFSYREYVRGGLRYDFSTGVVFGFGVNDVSYRKAPTAFPDSIRIEANEKTNRYLPSISAMIHASIRSWKQVTLGFTLGASINTTELDINSLFPGISLMIGKGEKIIFTVGPALKKINFLDSKYQKDKVYAGSEFPNEIPTAATFRIGWFLGVSYNLTKKQKSNFKLVKD